MTAPITWAEATSPILWSNIGIDWNTPAKTNSATFAANVGETHTEDKGIGYSITFAVTDTSTMGPGTIFTDEPIYTVNMGIAGSTSFLWNEEEEVTTTWTKVDYPN